MINLSLDELKLIAQKRNIREYKNKSKKGFGKSTQQKKNKNKN